MSQIKTYISAKLSHAKMLAALSPDGFHINARWIHMADAGREKLKPVSQWQQENFDVIDLAHVFILYVEPSDDLNGSIFEIGYAVRAGKLCWVAGNAIPDGSGGWHGMVEVTPPGAANSIQVPHKGILSWGLYRQRIKFVPNLEIAFKDIKQVLQPRRNLNTNGEETPRLEF